MTNYLEPSDVAMLRAMQRSILEKPDRYEFSATNWPEPYRTDYLRALTALGRARVAVARFDEFIRSGGKS
jgi:hypothetical protein